MRLQGVQRAIDAAASGNDPDVIFTRTGALLRRGAAEMRAALDRIDALDKPGSAENRIRAWIAANRRQAALTDDLAAGFAAQDETRIAQLSERVDELDGRNDEAARALGLPRCAASAAG